MPGDLVGAEGRVRRDREAVATALEAARADPRVREAIGELQEFPAAAGSSGLLLRGRSALGESVVLKVNASLAERTWLEAMAATGAGVVPRVRAAGDDLGGTGLGWIIMEHLPHQPPGLGAPGWYEPLLEATARWQDAAQRTGLVPEEEVSVGWVGFWLDAFLDQEQHPDVVVLRERLNDDWAWVVSLFDPAIAHGDLHFFNAGSREQSQPASLVLFDPQPRVAPWPFDAAYCHTLTNYATVVPGGTSLVDLAAGHRARRGLSVPAPSDLDRVSRLMHAWLAVMWRIVFGPGPQLRANALANVADAIAT